MQRYHCAIKQVHFWQREGGGGGVGAYYGKGNLGGAHFGRDLGQYWGKFNCHMCFHLVALIPIMRSISKNGII